MYLSEELKQAIDKMINGEKFMFGRRNGKTFIAYLIQWRILGYSWSYIEEELLTKEETL